MTSVIAVLVIWVVLSIPVALLLARMFPTSSPHRVPQENRK